jgi:hypothetical protein
MQPAVRARPPLLRALGSSDPPDEIELNGQTYRRVDIFKHDSWAATARYRGPRDVVCKVNRTQPILGLPMIWLGRWLAARERAILRQLSGLAGLPAECGPVFCGGRRLPTAVAHEYIPGRPLGSRDRPGDTFFPRLLTLLEEVHRRGIAYVDLHKRENIVVAEDGSPQLVDFQVCFCLPAPWLARIPPLGMVLRALQRLDIYCVAKHIRKHRPDQLPLVASRQDARRPWWINVHRFFAVPLRQLRRSLLVAIGVRQPGGRAASEAFAEDAFR